MSENKILKPIESLSKPLDKSDIEFRIGSIKDGKGFSLLAYKTARADVKRLNSVFGLGWKNDYFYDNKGILCCEISIFDEKLKEWVSRRDVGTESNTEKEKGSYSDAFKRAGFKWGIGIELYDFPFIWINWDSWYKGNNGKQYPTSFNAGDLVVEDYQIENGIIQKLKILHKKDIVFELGKYVEAIQKPTTKPKTISKPQLDGLLNFISEKGADTLRLCEFFGVKDLTKLNQDQYKTAMNMLNKK